MECLHKRAGGAELVSPELHRGPQETVFVSWGGSVGIRDSISSLL